MNIPLLAHTTAFPVSESHHAVPSAVSSIHRIRHLVTSTSLVASFQYQRAVSVPQNLSSAKECQAAPRITAGPAYDPRLDPHAVV